MGELIGYADLRFYNHSAIDRHLFAVREWDWRIVYVTICVFTFQLSPILITPTNGQTDSRRVRGNGY